MTGTVTETSTVLSEYDSWDDDDNDKWRLILLIDFLIFLFSPTSRWVFFVVVVAPYRQLAVIFIISGHLFLNFCHIALKSCPMTSRESILLA